MRASQQACAVLLALSHTCMRCTPSGSTGRAICPCRLRPAMALVTLAVRRYARSSIRYGPRSVTTCRRIRCPSAYVPSGHTTCAGRMVHGHGMSGVLVLLPFRR